MLRNRKGQVINEPAASMVISSRFSRVVWGAVFAGTVIAIVTQTLLALLGSSIGFAVIDVGQGSNVKAIGAGAAVWWLISGALALYAGAWVSGRMAGIPRPLDGALHGLVMWGLTTILTFFLLTTSVGMLISGGFGFLRSAGGAVSAAVPQVAQTFTNANIQQELSPYLQQRGLTPENQAGVVQQVMGALGAMALSNNPQEQQQQIVDVLVQNTTMSRQEASSQVDRWRNELQNVKQQAASTAEDAAETASKAAAAGAFASWVMLLIGGIVSAIGGSRGAPHWSEQPVS